MARLPCTERQVWRLQNNAAALPRSLPYQPLDWGAITMYVDPKARTTAMVYGNDLALGAAHTRRGARLTWLAQCWRSSRGLMHQSPQQIRMPAIAGAEPEMMLQSFVRLLPEGVADDGRHAPYDRCVLGIAARLP
jgi:hypothetical protein